MKVRLKKNIVLLLVFCLSQTGVTLAARLEDNKLTITNINPLVSPETYFNNHKDTISVIPDGTGVQILFFADEHYYLLAGPRSQRLLTLNGGKIEDTSAPFLQQLQEEMNEETFGLVRIKKSGKHFVLIIDHHTYSLQIINKKTMIQEAPGRFAYVTFTGLVSTVTKEQLTELANQLTPTAVFWEKAGSFLFQRVQEAPQDHRFMVYWQAQQSALNTLLSELTMEYDRLMQNGELLISPQQAFEVTSLDAAWETLRTLNSFAQLKYCFQNTVGRYSERKGYFVIDAKDLLAATNTGQPVKDINGQTVSDGIFNIDAVKRVFPLIIQEDTSDNLAAK
ncbi:hypothetical protein [Legionella spiritensis]|uniref:hypothetical protein n=1 Tax=Legionella spiritensis TaxID=452 RepID=UPI000F6D0271|nr:hypothetical protein [Legionella spiritensis]VEG92301.1 Uncharacterised protein [Legionella spiritensis]